MAAVVAVLKKGGRRFSVALDDGGLDLSTKVPAEPKRKIDVNVETLLNGTWQRRRMVLTRDTLYMSMVGEDEVRDSIPLHEIICIEVMSNPDELEELSNPFQASSKAEGLRMAYRKLSREFSAIDFQNVRPQNTFTFLHAFQIRTIPEGFNSGRVYYFQTEDAQTCSCFVEELQQHSDAAVARAEKATKFRQSQKFVASIYNSTLFQGLSASLIVANFATCIATAQLSVTNRDGNNGGHEGFLHMLEKLDVFFVIAFTVELFINAYANWFTEFAQNAWSLFDIVIVFVSLVGLAPLGIPLGLLLLLRSCRVLRIFGKFKSVSQIFSALAWSVLPMANVFFIIFVIASIYAIIAVTFFADNAPEELSTFARAFMSMFRITIGSVEWWFDAFPAVNPDYSLNWWPSFFLITYVIIVTWVFFQVSIAVLLDNFLSASNTIKLEETIAAMQRKQLSKQFKNPLDPLLLRLSKDYINEADLTLRIQELFKVLDSDGSGDLSSSEFQVAMKKLEFSPRMFVSDSDFMAITKNKTLCNPHGNLGPKEFETLMREQLRLYTQSRLSTTSEYWATTDQEFTPLASLKQILMEQLNIKHEQEVSKQEMYALVNETKGEVRQILKILREEKTEDITRVGSAKSGSKKKASSKAQVHHPLEQPECPSHKTLQGESCGSAPSHKTLQGESCGSAGLAKNSDRTRKLHASSCDDHGEPLITSREEIIAKEHHQVNLTSNQISKSFISCSGDLCLVGSPRASVSQSRTLEVDNVKDGSSMHKPQVSPASRATSRLKKAGSSRSSAQEHSERNVPALETVADTGPVTPTPQVLPPGTRPAIVMPSPQHGMRNDWNSLDSDHTRSGSGSPTMRKQGSSVQRRWTRADSEGVEMLEDVLLPSSSPKDRPSTTASAGSVSRASAFAPETSSLGRSLSLPIPRKNPTDSAIPSWKNVKRRGGSRVERYGISSLAPEDQMEGTVA